MFFRVFNNRISEDNFRLNEMRQRPFAVAKLRGSKEFENISGEVNFFRSKDGIIVAVYVNNLPVKNENCKANIFGFHLHEGDMCQDGEIPFNSAGDHFNPNSCPHPAHAGDFPPLFAGKTGYAQMTFWTDRLTENQVIGKTVLIHLNPDDLFSQPSGNSGKRIACGVVVENN